jgi:hypothetical protein
MKQKGVKAPEMLRYAYISEFVKLKTKTILVRGHGGP